MKDERIIEKIKKVLELSRNNPSEEEAKAAALQAQKLLAKYHIDMAEVEDVDLDKLEEITESEVNVGSGKKWKYTLARIIAPNFRCKHFYYGKSTVVFYGHKTDAEVAAQTFDYLFKLGNKLGVKERNKANILDGSGAGVYNSFVLGFCAGIKSALDTQCTALALVVPEDVENNYTDRTKGFAKSRLSSPTIQANINSSRACDSAYASGLYEGRQAMGNRQLGGA